MSLIRKLLGLKSLADPTPDSLPAKDPKDFTLTKSSRPWATQEYWCTNCKSSRSYVQLMARICNNCGTYNKIDWHGCAVRQIWNGKKWVLQYRERGGKEWVDE